MNWFEDVLMVAVVWSFFAGGVAVFYGRAQAAHDRQQAEAAAHARPSTAAPAPAAGNPPALPR